MKTDLVLLEQELRPKLKALESRRTSVRNLLAAGMIAVALGAGSCAISCQPREEVAEISRGRLVPATAGVLGLGLLVLAGALLVPGLKRGKEHQGLFKADVVATIVNSVLPGAQYFPSSGITRAVFESAGLYEKDLGEKLRERSDLYQSDDLIEGVVGETPFQCADVQVQRVVEAYSAATEDRIELKPVFSGLFVRVDLDRELVGRTIVEARTASPKDREEFSAVQISGPIAGEFHVLSTWEAEAFDLLTPALQGRLLAFADRAQAPIRVAFSGRTAFLAIEYGRVLFEPKIVASIRQADLFSFTEPLELAAEFVRVLGLESGRRLPAGRL